MLKILFCGTAGVLDLDVVKDNIYLLHSKNCLISSLLGETELFLLQKF
jgi:hypothetical protein